ncbi:DUF4911 domain-containing protein [Thermodesulfobacteriota bacterium]
METIKQSYCVERNQIHYIRWTVESYDGMATVSTIDPQEAIIEIKISPGCEEIIQSLLDSMAIQEGIKLKQI